MSDNSLGFTVMVSIEDSQVTEVLEFDADDIYDASLAARVRAMARQAAFGAGMRHSAELDDAGDNWKEAARRGQELLDRDFDHG